MARQKSSTNTMRRRGTAARGGAVLGIDVGWNKDRATTGLCLLEWNGQKVSWQFEKAKADEGDRRDKLKCLVGKKKLLAVAVDGPLGRGLEPVEQYRTADALLSRGWFQRRGKPGPTNGKTGKELSRQASRWARLVVGPGSRVGAATHEPEIHGKAVVEAFPNAFLAVLHPDDAFPSPLEVKRKWTDWLWPCVSDRLAELVRALLPGRKPSCKPQDVKGHDNRAAFVCALTALCAAAGRCVAVGDENNGYIVLPPLEHWRASVTGRHNRWAEDALRANWKHSIHEFKEAQIWTSDRLWLPRS